jgi:hypothetical protein
MQRCETCGFWAQMKANGACRRFPPVPDIGPGGWHGAEADWAYGIWPTTDQDDWCGEYQERTEG